MNILQFLAISKLPLGNATVIFWSCPIYVAILSAIFLGERMTPMKILCVLLTVGGCVLVAKPEFVFGPSDRPSNSQTGSLFITTTEPLGDADLSFSSATVPSIAVAHWKQGTLFYDVNQPTPQPNHQAWKPKLTNDQSSIVSSTATSKTTTEASASEQTIAVLFSLSAALLQVRMRNGQRCAANLMQPRLLPKQATSLVLLRSLRTVDPMIVIFHYGIFGSLVCIFSALVLERHLIPPFAAISPIDGISLVFPAFMPWLIVLGAAIANAVCNTVQVKACAMENANAIGIVSSLEVVYSYISEILVWGQVPDVLSLVGAALVLASVVLLGSEKLCNLNKSTANDDVDQEDQPLLDNDTNAKRLKYSTT